MTLPLWLILFTCLPLGGLIAWGRNWAWRRRWGRRAFVETAPAWRRFFRKLQLIETCDFLQWPSIIVSGHLDRHVARVRLGEGATAIHAYLKREHTVPFLARLRNALAGFGFCSRSLREMRTLQALSREAFGVPEWLAAGEDGEGRAFLLIREVEGAVDFRTYLGEEKDPARRLAVARTLAAMLARLHDAGFDHPDLYAKHVLVEPQAGKVALLDWQRARRRRGQGWRARGRSLAALNATLDASLARPGERLAFLRAYLEAAQQHPEEAEVPGRAAPSVAPRRAARLRLVLEGLRARTQRLLGRRHVREKRQLPGPAQAWTHLDGYALSVTPTMQHLCPETLPPWLSLDRQPRPAGRAVTRRWEEFANGTRALLVRRWAKAWWPRFVAWLRGTPVVSAEQRTAALLLRLERHAIAAPAVLALGQRCGAAGVDSFLLTRPQEDTRSLETWLTGTTPPEGESSVRRQVLRQAGAMLARLHGATCYFSPGAHRSGLAVRLPGDAQTEVVLEDPGAVAAERTRSPSRERNDLAIMEHWLSAAGCRRTDLARFLAGYRAERSPVRASRRQAAIAARGGVAVVAPPRLPGNLLQTPITTRPKPAAEARAVELVPTQREGFWQRLTRGVRRLRQRSDWPAHAGAEWPDRIMSIEVTDQFHAKQGRSTGRWALTPSAPGVWAPTVYLKRHHRLPWWQGWLAAFWPDRGWSPALQEWRHLQWARRQGIPVPAVVAAAEYIGPWGRLQSMLAVEELTGMLPLQEAIPLAATQQDPAAFRRWKRSLVAEMARLARMLHDRCVFHKDLYLCHFYVARSDTAAIPTEGWRGKVYLIDLHRLAHHPWTWPLWQLKDLAQLLYSSEIPGVDARDRLWFWRAYRGDGPRRGAGRWLRRCVWLKWQRYRRHNSRHNGAPDEARGATTT
jgi:heptose I phosphotransferase